MAIKLTLDYNSQDAILNGSQYPLGTLNTIVAGDMIMFTNVNNGGLVQGPYHYSEIELADHSTFNSAAAVLTWTGGHLAGNVGGGALTLTPMASTVWSGGNSKTLSANLDVTIGSATSGILLITNTGSYTFKVYGTAFTIRNSGTNGGRTIVSYVTNTDGTIWVESDADNLPIPVSPPLPQLTTPPLTATVISNTEIDLSWLGASNATGYVLDRSPNGTSGWTNIYTGSGAGFNDTGLSAGTHYYYRVKATGAGYSDSNYGTDDDTTTGSSAVSFNAAVIDTNGDDSRTKLMLTPSEAVALVVSSGGAMSSTINPSNVTVSGKTVTAVDYVGSWRDATTYFCTHIRVTVSTAFAPGYSGTVTVNSSAGVVTRAAGVPMTATAMTITDYGVAATGTPSTIVLDGGAGGSARLNSLAGGGVTWNGNSSLGRFYNSVQSPYVNPASYAPFDSAIGSILRVEYDFTKGVEPYGSAGAGGTTVTALLITAAFPSGIVVGEGVSGTSNTIVKVHPNTTGAKSLWVFNNSGGSYHAVDFDALGSGGSSSATVATIWS